MRVLFEVLGVFWRCSPCIGLRAVEEKSVAVRP
jgi:hypothetical protein